MTKMHMYKSCSENYQMWAELYLVHGLHQIILQYFKIVVCFHCCIVEYVHPHLTLRAHTLGFALTSKYSCIHHYL